MPDPSQMTGLQWIILVLMLLALLGLRKWVAKKAENVATKQDIAHLTRLVEDIKADHARELERLKSSLLKDVESHRVQYETDLQTYKEIWAAAYDVHTTASQLRRVSPQSTPEELQVANDAQVAYLRAARAYEEVLWKHRPFFPNELYLELQQLGRLLAAEYHQSYQTPITTKMMIESLERTSQIMRSISATCEAIRRRLHGASQGDPTGAGTNHSTA